MKEELNKGLNYKITYKSSGLHLNNTILWLDSPSYYKEGLSFLSSAICFSSLTKNSHIITTEETTKILEAKNQKINALICPYNRPFSIGKLKMELLPSGCILGGASLYLETNYGRVLYAPQLQTNKNLTVRQMQLKKAQTLILGSNHPDPNIVFPNRKKEKERILDTIDILFKSNITPIILCNPLGIAQELTKLISNASFNVQVHPSIFKINKIYESYDTNLGSYKLYKPSNTHSTKSTILSVLIFPLYHANWKLKKPLPSGKILYVEDGIYPTLDPDFFTNVYKRFYISLTSDSKELKDIISIISPKEIYFIGPYAKTYSQEFKNFAKKVNPLYPNNQLTLF